MWKITENLYLATFQTIVAPTNKEEFKAKEIKNVLTVVHEPIPENQQLPGVQYKFIPLLDMPKEPILSNRTLEKAVSYIVESVEKEENVVVHCVAAVSRSVTVCAAYLMYKNRWSMEKALDMVMSIRKTIGPNQGFLAQLKIWERSEMSFSVEKYIDLEMFVPGQRDPDRKTLWRQPVIDDRTKLRFKCRQCRKTIFNCDNLVHPQITESCQGYLIEPMKWLVVSSAECSISHTCGAKLGTFIASGSKCNGCNKYVKLWIFVDKSKVDRVEATV